MVWGISKLSERETEERGKKRGEEERERRGRDELEKRERERRRKMNEREREEEKRERNTRRALICLGRAQSASNHIFSHTQSGLQDRHPLLHGSTLLKSLEFGIIASSFNSFLVDLPIPTAAQ